MNLKDKIKDKKAKIAVVGLGYVGLPMAVTVARHEYQTIGIDVSTFCVENVNNGINYIGDVDDDELKEIVNKGFLKATTDYSVLSEIDVILIAVPTPLDKYHQPDSSYIKDAINSIANNIKTDTLIVLESTTYPGTTEEIIVKTLKEKEFEIGKNVYVAFSPERVDPGNKSYKTHNTPKVVGGVTESCNSISKLFYECILDATVHLVSSPAVAEMEKIYENTFRNINIALANEMTILAEKMGIDIWEVIEAAKTKPYGFMAFYPGPGVGGHCIPIDPFYLTWKAREYNYHTKLIELAGEINMEMPTFVVNKASRILNMRKGKALSQSKILLLGAAYKKDIEDVRESPIENIIVELEKHKANFEYNDPFVPEFKNEVNKKTYHSVDLDNIGDFDLVVVITNHTKYDFKKIVKQSQLILDTRYAIKNINSDKVIKL